MNVWQRATRLVIPLAMTAVVLVGSTASAAANRGPVGSPGQSPLLAIPTVVFLRQVATGRYLDAHEISSQDFTAVTRPFQNNTTQEWLMTPFLMPSGLLVFELTQVKTGKLLDAHEIPSLDFRAVVRPRQNNDTQRWFMVRSVNGFFSIQQMSSGRFLEAYVTSGNDFRVITRDITFRDTQLWDMVVVHGPDPGI